MIVSKNSYVRGSTVLAPEFLPDRDEEYKKIKEAQKKALENIRRNNIKKKIKALRGIALIFVFGLVIVWRYSVIYSMQKDLNNTKSQIVNISRENENLKVELVKFSSMQNIEDNAVNKLKMVRPEKSNAAFADLEKQNFVKVDNGDKADSGKNLWDRIISLLF